MVNSSKTKVLIFSKTKRKTSYNGTPNFSIGGNPLQVVEDYKYLGIVLTHNLCVKEDILRQCLSFNRSAGMFHRKFSGVNLQLKHKLLQLLCMDFFGAELLQDLSGAREALKKLAVFYHYSLKRLLHLPKRFSNHLVCCELNVLIFEHLLNLKLFKFLLVKGLC